MVRRNADTDVETEMAISSQRSAHYGDVLRMMYVSYVEVVGAFEQHLITACAVSAYYTVIKADSQH